MATAAQPAQGLPLPENRFCWPVVYDGEPAFLEFGPNVVKRLQKALRQNSSFSAVLLATMRQDGRFCFAVVDYVVTKPATLEQEVAKWPHSQDRSMWAVGALLVRAETSLIHLVTFNGSLGAIPAVQFPAGELAPQRRGNRWLFRLFVATAGVLAFFALSRIFIKPRAKLLKNTVEQVQTAPERTEFGTPLGATASWRGEGVQVWWDRLNPNLESAISGALLLNDGKKTSTIPLTADQLKSGQYFLTSVPKDIHLSFGLRAADGQRLHDAVHFIGEGVIVGEGSRTRTSEATPPQIAGTVPTPVTPTLPLPATAPERHTTTPRAMVVPLGSRMEHPAGPELTAAIPDVAPPGQIPALPSVSVPVNPAPLSGASRLLIPAVPVRQVAVVLPESLKTVVHGRSLELSLIASVNTEGRVTSVRTAKPLTGLSGHLAEVAAQTLKSWRFRPAMVGERPEPSEYPVQFRFGDRAR